MNEGPPLHVAQCGAAREAWAAGPGVLLSFQRDAVALEPLDTDEAPAAMGLDLVGTPWLVTERAVLRRHVDAGLASWRTYYRRDPDRPPLVAIGFTPDDVRVLDARGAAIHIRAREADGLGTVRPRSPPGSTTA